jgi:putative NIF3 family GTP cyclohydrolase 1 type 2
VGEGAESGVQVAKETGMRVQSGRAEAVVHSRFVRFANFIITSQSRHRSAHGLLIKNKFPYLAGHAVLALPAHTSGLLLWRPILSIMNTKFSSATPGMSDPIF